MSVTFNWHGKEFEGEAHRRIMRGIKAVVIFAQAKARELASVHNEGVRHKRVRATKQGGKGSQYTTYPNSSKPGEPPRRRTGFGQKNILAGWDDTTRTGRVGFGQNAKYMAFHELGIQYRTLQRRPTLALMIAQHKSTLADVFSRAARGAK
jgi:hypothetical protein